MLSFGPISGAPISGAGAGVDIQVPAAAIATTALAPAVAAGVTIPAPAAAIVTQGAAPAVAGGASITVSAAATTDVQAYPPVIELALEINAPAAEIIAAALAPAISAGVTVSVPAAAIVTQGIAPAVAAGVSLAVPAAGTIVTAYPPAIDIFIPARAEPVRVYLVDIEGVDAAGDPQVLRFSSGYGYTSRGDDDPAWTTWLPGLKVTGNVEINLFAPGATQGAARAGYGEIRIANVDGAWDHLIGWAFDGRRIRIRRLPHERAALSDAVTVFTGAAHYAEYDLDGVSWTVRSRMDVLRRPIQTARYKGTTTSAVAEDRAEGNEDVAGRILPLIFGRVRNVEAVPVNIYSDRIIGQVCANGFSSLPGLYDRGAPLDEAGEDVADLEGLELAEVPSGGYVTESSGGRFKAGAWPDGKLTADVLEGATAADRTAAQIVRRILLNHGGQTTDDLVEASYTALDATADAETGIPVTDEREVLDVVSEILQSVDATLAEDRLGRFGVYQVNLPDPEAVPAVVLTADDILDDDIEWIAAQDGNGGIPPWQLALRYRPNWSVASRDELAGVVLECAEAERIGFLTTEWRTVTAEDEDVLTRHPLSRPVTQDSLIDDPDAAADEAARRFALRKTLRHVIRFPVPAARVEALELLDVALLRFGRYGNAGGLLYRIIGMVHDFDNDRVTLSLWGGVPPPAE